MNKKKIYKKVAKEYGVSVRSGRGRSSAMWAQPDMPPARIWISASSRTVNT